MRWTRGRSDAGYVTVEAALVLSAVTGVAALLIAGIVTGVAWIGATGDPGGGSGTGGLQVLRVTVQRRVALWSVTGEAAVVVEPGDGDGQGP